MLEAAIHNAKGTQTLESIEVRDHREAIELEREMGFTASSMHGDATLVVSLAYSSPL